MRPMRLKKPILSRYSFSQQHLLGQHYHLKRPKISQGDFLYKPEPNPLFRSFHNSSHHLCEKKIDIQKICSADLKDIFEKSKEGRTEEAFPLLLKTLSLDESDLDQSNDVILSDKAIIYGLFGCYNNELDCLSRIDPVIKTDIASGNSDPVGPFENTLLTMMDQYKAPFREAKAYQYCNLYRQAAIRYAIDFNPRYYTVLFEDFIGWKSYRGDNIDHKYNLGEYDLTVSFVFLYGHRLCNTFRWYDPYSHISSDDKHEFLDDGTNTFEYEFLRNMSTEKILIKVENKNSPYAPDFSGLIGLAYIALLMDKKEIAETLFARAAKNCEKENPELSQGLALLAWKRGDHNKAQEYFSIVDQLNDHWEKSELWFSRAKIFAAWGEIKIAMELYDAAVKTNPLLLAASYELALLFKKQGSISQTKKQLESVLSQYPNHTEAKETLHQLNTQKKLYFDFFESPDKQDTSSKTFNDNTDHNRPGPKL